MRKGKLVAVVFGALLALGTLGAATGAEAATVTELTGTFKGGASSLTALGGKALTGTEVLASIKGCKEASDSPKDTDLCEATLTFKGVKQGQVNCRSETAGGTKDAIETVLVVTDLHLAAEKTAGGESEPLVLFKVLGQGGGEEELTINCGGVKNKVKGVIGCLLTPGSTTVVVGGTFTMACKQNVTTHDPETGECVQLCEWLKEHPFESNVGAGFEDSWMGIGATGTLNLTAYIDTEAPMLLVLEGEDANSPELLMLEGSNVKELSGKVSGGASELATLGGKTLTATELSATISECKEGASAKDTTLCVAPMTFKGFKQGKVACRSESATGTKDASETVLDVTDLHLAAEKASGGELEPLALFKVLGQAGGEGELTVNCGGVKDKVKGVFGCLLTPGLETVAAGATYTIACKQSATTHDKETGECEKLCEWLSEHPFEENLGAGFEDAWLTFKAEGTLNLSAYIDD